MNVNNRLLYKEMVQMAEFCLKCLRKFEPNVNEDNFILSNNLELCEGCGMLKKIVVEITNEN